MEESEEREGIGMEIIESYLDSMLGKLPDTPELRKARNELLQMMEDKFGELIEEGKSENEAAGTVIAEFGNLEELAESLGLRELLGKREIPKNPGRVLSLDEAERCLSDFTLRAVLAGIGLMLIIISPMAFFFSDELPLSDFSEDTLEMSFLFVLSALGSGFLIYASFLKKDWEFLKTDALSLGKDALEGLRARWEKDKTAITLCHAVGIALLILSPLPVVTELPREGFEIPLFLLLVGIGVFLLILAAARRKIYKRLFRQSACAPGEGSGGTGEAKSAFSLEQGSPDRREGEAYGARREESGHSPERAGMARTVLSCYWQTIGCIYLCWSFLSFDWGRTWLIFVVGAALFPFLRIMADRGI